MIEWLYLWVLEIAFLMSGIVYAHVREKREEFNRYMMVCVLAYIAVCACANLTILGNIDSIAERLFVRLAGFALLILFLHICWEITWSVAVYDSIWAVLSWQLLYEFWMGISSAYVTDAVWRGCAAVVIFAAGQMIAAFTIARWMPQGAGKAIGPRQIGSALLIFLAFEIIGLNPGDFNAGKTGGKWLVVYLTQLLLALILYLQNELFKKSAMQQEFAVMNMLWKMEKEQYQLSKENIALINQKCHDLKHQIRAIRGASREDIEKYLEEMEDSIQIYESIVKTGNEVLDTILTEKSLYCRERGITVSCVADGSQMDFINTVDLYAILGNAIDNAIEAVEKFRHEEKRQIDVLIHRQQNFLVINIINPIKGNLTYEEELPVTTKEDKQYHGFGLRSMRYLVKKYDGFLTVSEEDGCFSLKILIPIPADK